MESIIFYTASVLLLVYSFLKDKQKTKKAVKKSIKSLLGLLPQMSFILLLIGLSLAVLSPETISGVIGEESGVLGIGLSIVAGAVAFLPSFIAFPLGATLLEQGAGLAQVAGFISALMGIGFITLSMEQSYFGTKFAVYRNLGSLAMTLLFVFVVTIFMGGSL